MPLVELCLQIKLLSLGNIKPFLLKVTYGIFQIWIFELTMPLMHVVKKYDIFPG